MEYLGAGRLVLGNRTWNILEHDVFGKGKDMEYLGTGRLVLGNRTWNILELLTSYPSE